MKRLYIASMMTALVLTQTGCGGGDSSSQPTTAQSVQAATCLGIPTCANQAQACATNPGGAACQANAGGLIPGSSGGTVTIPSLPTGGSGTTTTAASGLVPVTTTTGTSPLVPVTTVASLRAESVVDSNGKPNYENLVQGLNNVVSGQSSVGQAAATYQTAGAAAEAPAGSGASQ